MRKAIEMSRAYNRCRSMFNDGDVRLTFNEALVLEVIFDEPMIMREIEDELIKDRSYLSRVMKKVVAAGYVSKRERLYVRLRQRDGMRRCVTA